MNASPRYAIYYAPTANHPLWQKGSAWLGRNAYTGEKIKRPEFAGYDDSDLDRITAAPAHYGFHATMKAPFELAENYSEQDLFAALETFSQKQTPFAVQLKVSRLGQFLALRIKRGEDKMRALHVACVKEFDFLRAPLSEADIERRRKSNLTDDQDAKLLAWGYPYIFDDFRWHMTLSNKFVSDNTRDKVLALLEEHFEDAIRAPVNVDGIAVYRQIDRCAPFNIIARARFSAQIAQTA